jgi:hypothetical protein
MSASRVRIGQLRLSVDGLTREQAARLAADVATRVAAALPAGVCPAASLQVRVTAERGASPRRLAEQIAGALVRGLR